MEIESEKNYDIQEKFVYYFKQLDFTGIKELLNHNPKCFYIELINEEFKKLKSEGITSLEAYPGKCDKCHMGYKGFTFIDQKSGFFIDLILESRFGEITFINECFDLKNVNTNLNKKKFLFMDPLASCNYHCK